LTNRIHVLADIPIGYRAVKDKLSFLYEPGTPLTVGSVW
jgi:hypothetical protein